MTKTKQHKILRLRAENDLAFYRFGLLSKGDVKEKTKTYRKKDGVEFNEFIWAQ